MWVDFYCPALKLAIEIDGDSHFQPGKQTKDGIRQQFIESTGVQFLRFRNVEIRENLRGVLEAIYRKIQELIECDPLPQTARRPLAKGDKRLARFTCSRRNPRWRQDVSIATLKKDLQLPCAASSPDPSISRKARVA
jgi:Protein of unknown function (DUF559)